jgi:hypothetical protein
MRWAPYNYGFGFQADLITMLLEEGADYVEVPVDRLPFREDPRLVAPQLQELRLHGPHAL